MEKVAQKVSKGMVPLVEEKHIRRRMKRPRKGSRLELNWWDEVSAEDLKYPFAFAPSRTIS